MFEPFASFGRGTFFLFSSRLVIDGGVGEGAGNRIEHYLHRMDHRSDLIGRQLVEQRRACCTTSLISSRDYTTGVAVSDPAYLQGRNGK